MKHLALATVIAASVAGGALAEPLLGTWRTAKDDNGNYGLIKVSQCGSKICGKLVKSYDASGNEISSEHTGRNIISETVASGGGQYKGKVYSPDRDKTYNSKLVLNGNSLKVSGCVLGICRDGGTWKRQ